MRKGKGQTTTSVGQIRSERTRRRLLEAARALMARRGYEATTVDDVAREADYSKGAYYFHFASKEDALLALVDGWAERRSRLLEAVASARPPEVRLARLLEAISHEPGDEDARLVLEFWSQAQRSPKVRQRLVDAYRSWRDLLVRTLVGAREAGVLPVDVDPAAAAAAVLAFQDGLAVQRVVGTSVRPLPTGLQTLDVLAAVVHAAQLLDAGKPRRAAV